ncbi:hypothetical protein ACP4OV_008593 [Aristida adscensionis]
MAGALSPVITKLSDLLSSEYTKLKSVRRKITFLRDELRSMNALLITLANVESLDELRKEWKNDVRELAYDMEDCIDSFMHNLHRGDAKPGIVKKTAREIKNLWVRHKVANKIQELSDRVKEVSERRSRYKLDEITASIATPVAIDPRLPVLLAESKSLIGVEGPRDVITGLLMDEEPQLKVVSIVGSAGLGKTTLAMEVYRSIGDKFQCMAWVSVSRRLDPQKLIKDILSQLEPKQHEHEQLDSLEQLIRKLRSCLQDKRYLTLIDDIWSVSDWEFVKSVLPENTHNSRVITTTRNTSVAKSCCSDFQELIYEIKHLDDINSRRLFMRRIFHSENDCPSQLERVSKEILKKCGGLPLAIVTISSLLSTKPQTMDQWELVKEGIVSAQEEASIKMKNILKFSYYDLPYYLRACWLYLSIFPEDHVIPKQRLIWKWIAEGFIDAEKGQNLEEVGENYFNELINRSMILPVNSDWRISDDAYQYRYDGRPDACRVHDVLLEFMVSMSEEEKFNTIFNGDQANANIFLDNIRRLSLHRNYHGNEDKQISMKSLSHVRSVHAFGSCKDIIQLDSPAMRVLDLEDCSLCLQVKNIHKCVQLKYLSISGTGVIEIPKEIGNLQYLETLDMRWTPMEGKLPPTIGQLKRLKHLFVSHDTILPDEIMDLRALQVMWTPTINSVKLVKWIGELKELRELHMGRIKPDEENDLKSYEESFVSCVLELGRHHLRVLLMFQYPLGRDCGFVNPLMNSCCSSISSSVSPVSSLIHLSHWDTWVPTMEQRYIDALRELPCLLFLRIVADYAPVERYVVSDEGFQSLKEFVFKVNFEGRTRLVFVPGAMPKLHKLELPLRAKGTKCDVGADLGLKHLSALKHVWFSTFCDDATSVWTAIRNAVASHPNHHTIRVQWIQYGWLEDKMLKDSREVDSNAGEVGATLD